MDRKIIAVDDLLDEGAEEIKQVVMETKDFNSMMRRLATMISQNMELKRENRDLKVVSVAMFCALVAITFIAE